MRCERVSYENGWVGGTRCKCSKCVGSSGTNHGDCVTKSKGRKRLMSCYRLDNIQHLCSKMCLLPDVGDTSPTLTCLSPVRVLVAVFMVCKATTTQNATMMEAIAWTTTVQPTTTVVSDRLWANQLVDWFNCLTIDQAYCWRRSIALQLEAPPLSGYSSRFSVRLKMEYFASRGLV